MTRIRIQPADIPAASIDGTKLTTGAVGSTNLAAGAVTTAAIAANAVDATKVSAAAQLTFKGGDKQFLLTALPCSADGSKVTTWTLPTLPIVGSIRLEDLNGVPQHFGDGVKTADFYFSAPATSGAVARILTTASGTPNLAIGDELYYNAVIANAPTLAGDLISIAWRE